MPTTIVRLPRFQARQHENGTWYVHDIKAGRPAEFVGRVFVDMDVQEADEACDLLNRLDEKARGKERR